MEVKELTEVLPGLFLGPVKREDKMTYREFSFSTDPIAEAHRERAAGEVVQLPKNNRKNARRAIVVATGQPRALEDGDTIRLEMEGVFKAPDPHRGWEPDKGGTIVSSLSKYITLATFTKYATVLKIEQPPEWVPGDVIDVTFPGGDQVYTYVRGAQYWPGNTRYLTDDRINDMWLRGNVEVVRKK